MAPRPLSKIDHLLLGVDKALRAVVPNSNPSTRPLPVSSDDIPELTITEARHVAGLMRINHTVKSVRRGYIMGKRLLPKMKASNKPCNTQPKKKSIIWFGVRLV